MEDDVFVVSEKDLYTFTKLDDGSVEIKHNSEDTSNKRIFQVKITIPSLEGKKMCMVRFNFSEFTYLTITARSEANETIDTFLLSPFEAKLKDVGGSADLFGWV